MAPRIPKSNARFINPEAESIRGRGVLAALKGYVGAEEPSVMVPGASEAYRTGEMAGLAEMLIPGAGLAKGALSAALAGVIKPRGGNWLPGSVENALRGIKKPELSPAMDVYGNIVPNALINSPTAISNSALNKWIEGPLTKYIKRDMATPNDPVMALAEQNILHYVPGREFYRPDINIDRVRQRAGFPAEGIGKSDLARKWENVSDEMIVPADVAKLRLRNALPDEDWINKLSDDSKMYSTLEPGYFKDSTGFGHLVDELSNALDPESGLPRNLLLRPEQMQQMGMEKAVRHVDAINKWRAAQKAAADAELANKASVVREYAENNPKGLRWMELGKDTPDLEKQLKYEGDTMGHCVGRYCPDVLEGRSRIFSLRDAKGEPHVTIETKPVSETSISGDLLESLEPGLFKKYADESMYPTVREWLKNERPDIFNMNVIEQIKGKQNLAPKDEYLPFVQDFVRNNPLGSGWGRVGDLRNTGLRKVGDRYVTLDELKDVPKTSDGFPIGYEPLDDLPDWKDGGLVEFPNITPKAMLNRIISAYNAL